MYKIVHIGLGVVGEAYLHAFSKYYQVVGIDINRNTVYKCAYNHAKNSNVTICHLTSSIPQQQPLTAHERSPLRTELQTDTTKDNKTPAEATSTILDQITPIRFIYQEHIQNGDIIYQGHIQNGDTIEPTEFSENKTQDTETQLFANVKFIMIAVNTPTNNMTTHNSALNMTYLFNTIPLCAKIITYSPNAQIIIRSTVEPGTTQIYAERVYDALSPVRIVDKSVLIANTIFQPEFLRAISARDDAEHPWAVIFGINIQTSITDLLALYSKYIDNDKIMILTVPEAELLKIYHNAFNACKISFFNQCQLISTCCSHQNQKNVINHEHIEHAICQTCEGLINRKYGTKSGFAFGGACLPKDSREFVSLEKKYNLPSLMDNVLTINDIFDDKKQPNSPNHMNALDLTAKVM